MDLNTGIGCNQVDFFLAKVPDAYLNQVGDMACLQRVVHDGCVGISKPFVRFSQVHVGINLQDPKRAVHLAQCPDIPQRGAVISSKQRNQLPFIQQGGGSLFDPLDHFHTGFIHFFEQLVPALPYGVLA